MPAENQFSGGGAEPTEEWEKDPSGRAAEVIATPKRIGHNWTVFRLPADSPSLPFPPLRGFAAERAVPICRR